MRNTWRDRIIALAGVAQAIDLMDQLAKTGYLNTQDFETCVRSLFVQDPTNNEEVFGSVDRLERGVTAARQLLENGRADEQAKLTGYCLGIFHLQKKLSKNKPMLATIGTRLDKARHQVEHFGLTHDNVIANLAEAYVDTVSTFPFRIQVVGDHQYLQQTRVANQVRVLLLAAIRASTLWRQTGGSRWHLLFHRRNLLSAAKALKEEIAQRNNLH